MLANELRGLKHVQMQIVHILCNENSTQHELLKRIRAAPASVTVHFHICTVIW
jgi:hypothetical protein